MDQKHKIEAIDKAIKKLERSHKKWPYSEKLTQIEKLKAEKENLLKQKK